MRLFTALTAYIFTLFAMLPGSYTHAAPIVSQETTDQWYELILYRDLIRKEVAELQSIPKDFKKDYLLEIKSKTKAMVLLDTVLKIKSKAIIAKGRIPSTYKKNPFNEKFNEHWSTIISQVDSLSSVNCNVKTEKICRLVTAKTPDETLSLLRSHKHTSIYTKINQYIAKNNWTEALRYTYKLSEIQARHKLTYDIIQRVYSLKHQGAGEVAIKGI